jgi:hypothetical protein
VDRTAVSFYEVGGWSVDPDDPDPYNVYNDSTWRPLLQLAAEKTDLIRTVRPRLTPSAVNCRDEFFQTETYVEGVSRFTTTTLHVAGRELTSLTRRDPDIHTVWTLKHFLTDLDDLKAFLELPQEVWDYDVDVTDVQRMDAEIGDAGIVMVDTADPICVAAELFSMADYTIMAMTEPEWFTRLLDRLAPPIHRRTEEVARLLPGRLWRLCGSEYASEPYLPPRLYEQYVVRYTGPMVESIRRHGGLARIHSHGRLAAILPHIVAMGADATDPVEPPPQGDVQLADVRREYGKDLVLFGNIEVSDLENLPPEQFEKVVAGALADGTAGDGRGFVLMPTAAPYGRKISPRTMTNYETMVRLAESFGG